MGGWMAMQLKAAGRPPQPVWRARRPMPGPGRVGLRVLACGVCRTDLHEGRQTGAAVPLV